MGWGVVGKHVEVKGLNIGLSGITLLIHKYT